MAHPFPLSSFRIASADQNRDHPEAGREAGPLEPGAKAPWPRQPTSRRRKQESGCGFGHASQADSAHPVTNDESPNKPDTVQRRADTAREKGGAGRVRAASSPKATAKTKILTDMVAAQPQLARKRAQALAQAFAQKK